jgi:hypothetical protein
VASALRAIISVRVIAAGITVRVRGCGSALQNMDDLFEHVDAGDFMEQITFKVELGSRSFLLPAQH